MSLVNVVIVNYFGSSDVEACLDSLKGQVNGKICIVDNSNDDDEFGKLNRLSAMFENVGVVNSKENLGFGRGVNFGVAHFGLAATPTDLIWVLNPDTIVADRCVERLTKAIDATKSEIASPAITYGNPEHIWYAGGSYNVASGVVRHVQYGANADDLAQVPYLTPYMCGAAPLFTAAAWNTLHGFREDLFMYWEDVDLSIRAAENQVSLMVVPQARIWHRVNASSTGEQAGFSRLFYYYSARNRAIVTAEYQRTIISRLRFFAESLRLVVRPIKNETQGRLGKARGAIAGIREGRRYRHGVQLPLEEAR